MRATSSLQTWSHFYVPEIHDVYPGSARELARLLDVLPDNARERVSLLLVPYWQERYALSSDKAFCQTLRNLRGEIVLHGWTHSLGPDWWNWLWYGHDDRSEFATLTAREAAHRLALGRQALADAVGRAPRWFCAPRWQQSRAVAPELKAAGFFGFQFYDRLELCSGERIPLVALCFDEGERNLRIALGRSLRARAINNLMHHARPFRLTLHPNDMNHARTWAQLTSVISRLDAEGWTAVSIDEAVELWRRTNTGFA